MLFEYHPSNALSAGNVLHDGASSKLAFLLIYRYPNGKSSFQYVVKWIVGVYFKWHLGGIVYAYQES